MMERCIILHFENINCTKGEKTLEGEGRPDTPSFSYKNLWGRYLNISRSPFLHRMLNQSD